MRSYRLLSITVFLLKSTLAGATVVQAFPLATGSPWAQATESPSLDPSPSPTLNPPSDWISSLHPSPLTDSSVVAGVVAASPDQSPSPSRKAAAQDPIQAFVTPAQVASSPQPSLLTDITTLQDQPQPEEALKIGQRYEQDSLSPLPVATLYDYEMDNRSVTTVYVRDLPIVSFVEEPDTASPLLRGSALAAQINHLAQHYLKDQSITLDLVTEPGQAQPIYAIKSADQELVRFDRGIWQADTPAEVANAALLATNRLRRLLLDAPPLSIPPLPSADTGIPENLSAASPGNPVAVLPGSQQQGLASWYGHSAQPEALTAAHLTLPFGTQVQVTNLENGKRTVVEINDRGPFIQNRIIDLSLGAAQALGMIQSGVVPVKVEVVKPKP
ncbi:MAG: septal ring lytic transglycosylase RlpA family protein [Cyanobacteriota bacterium]|nr:septal ring lytic transglycosylase RlpA family protein [Cyanobacteriota bacterium]